MLLEASVDKALLSSLGKLEKADRVASVEETDSTKVVIVLDASRELLITFEDSDPKDTVLDA